MKSKRGIIITAIVLAAITAASFAVWMIPQSAPTKFVVSSPGEDLDAMMEQQKTVSSSATEEFERFLSGQITADNYINIAEISHSQVNSLIIKIVDSEIPAEWNDSYGAFLEHLRAYNSYLRETIVVANKLKDSPGADISPEQARLDQYLAQADEYLTQSDASRP